MDIIRVDHLTKIYKQQQRPSGFVAALKSLFTSDIVYKKAVDDVSFEVAEGEIVGLLGPNGAGKTTVLKILSGILRPTDGEVEVAGHSPYLREDAFKKKISLIVGQKNQMMWDLPAMDTLLWLKEIYDIEKPQFEDTVQKLSRLFQAEDLLNLQVRRMSLGQRMKMELIASMLHNPSVVFLDEPTIGLDIVTQNSLREFIKEYNKQTNATIILTSHNLADIESLCKKVILINQGKITHNNSLNKLVESYCDYKLIKLQGLDEPIEDSRLIPGLEITSRSDDTIWLKVKQDLCQESIKYLWSNFTFRDICIEDVSINEIIEKAFSDTTN